MKPANDTDSAPSVLIVEQSAEMRDVLRTALERRGMRIFEAAEPRRGLELLREFHPQVTVLDADSESPEDSEMHLAYDAESGGTALVVLGNTSWPSLPQDRVVRKPYHFAPLIRTIEDLLEQSATTVE